MKYFFTIAIISFSLLSYGQQLTENFKVPGSGQTFKIQSTKRLGETFKQFKVPTSNFDTFSNADLTGKIVFINFWFEGCPPCIAELEGFNKLFDTLKNNKDFLFVSFTFDPDSTINKIKKEYKIKYTVYHLERPECYRLNFNDGFPSTFILDKKGIIKYYKGGGAIDKEKSTKMVMEEFYPKIIEQL